MSTSLKSVFQAACFDMQQGYYLKTKFFNFYKVWLKYLGPNLLGKMTFFEKKFGFLKSVSNKEKSDTCPKKIFF